MLKRNKVLCVLLSTAMLFAGVVFPTASAAVLEGYRGDLNGDMQVTVADAVIMAKYLTNQGDLTITKVDFADLDHNNAIDAVDLTLLKRTCMGLRQAEIIIKEGSGATEPFIYLPESISASGASLPSQGEAKVVIFSVEFPDCKFGSYMSAEQIAQVAFGDENTSIQSYPMDSITAYFKRASNGALDITGDVYTYTAQQSISVYNDDRGALVKEAYNYFSAAVDFSQYDGNGDGIIDATIVGVPESADDNYWWPCSGGFDTSYRVDGMQVGNICTGYSVPVNQFDYISTWVHELGHCMGLPDYYMYEGADIWGFHGTAGIACMDDAYGDFCGISKLLCGWYPESEVLVYDPAQGTQTFFLASAQEYGGCIVIKRDSGSDDWFNEFFIVEYVTPTGNYSNCGVEGGIRVMHAQCELTTTYWGSTFTYCSGGPGQTADGIRMARLVNDGNGFFQTGSNINSSVSGFGWYDASTLQQTVNPGVNIAVGDLVDGRYQITISPN